MGGQGCELVGGQLADTDGCIIAIIREDVETDRGERLGVGCQPRYTCPEGFALGAKKLQAAYTRTRKTYSSFFTVAIDSRPLSGLVTLTSSEALW